MLSFICISIHRDVFNRSATLSSDSLVCHIRLISPRGSGTELHSFVNTYTQAKHSTTLSTYPPATHTSKLDKQHHSVFAYHGVSRTNPPYCAITHNAQPSDPDPRPRNNHPRRQLLPQSGTQSHDQRFDLCEARRLQGSVSCHRRRLVRGQSKPTLYGFITGFVLI